MTGPAMVVWPLASLVTHRPSNQVDRDRSCLAGAGVGSPWRPACFVVSVVIAGGVDRLAWQR
jgi:hypothetical protein